MKTKFRMKAIALPLVFIAAIFLSSCGDHNAIGPVTPIKRNIKPVNQVFIPQAEKNPLSRVNLVIDTTYTYEYGAAYNGTTGPAQAPADIQVKFSVNQSAVDNFNAAMGRHSL